MSCPSFARSTVESLRANSAGVDVALLVLDQMAYTLVSSVVLAPVGLQVAAVSAGLTLLLGDCEGDAVVQAVARRATLACDALVVVCDVGIVASTILLNPAAAAFFATARGLFDSLRGVFRPIAAARPPSSTATRKFVNAAGDAGDVDTDKVEQYFRVVEGALIADPRVAKQVATVDEENPGPIVPTFTWEFAAAPAGYSGSSTAGVFQAYSHAYQAAAEAAYAVVANADLRPWLLEQVGVDLAYLEEARNDVRQALALGMLQPQQAAAFLQRLNFAFAGLGAWLLAAEADPQGAWSRATLRRVLRSSVLQTNLPATANPGEGGADNGGGGSSGSSGVPLLLLAAAAAAALR